MTNKRWDVAITAVLCTGLGIGSGYYAAVQSGPPTAAPESDAAGAAAAAEPDGDHLSDETLQTLGVECGPLQATSSSRTTSVVATVVETARSTQPVQAPIDGTVTAVLVDVGVVVQAGAPIARLIRRPIPLPLLELTAPLVAPEHAEIHASIRELREANAEIGLTRVELERIGRFTDGSGDAPVLPLQRRIDLEYALERARVRAEISHHELERHGFSEEQIAGVAVGEHVELFDAAHVRRSLVHAGLWSERSERALAALPEQVAALPTAVGAVAELGAKGLVDDAFCEWLETSPAAGERFLSIASLLLAGSGIDEVERMLALGALSPTVDITAADLAPDWDVVGVHVRPGDHVVAGASLVTLRDARALRLRLDPVGSEVALLQRAVAAGEASRALPLVSGSGPALDDVRIDYVANDDAADRVHGWARLDNRILAGSSPARDDGPEFRSWALHAGLRYRVLVPTAVVDAVYELPRAAVTTDGPDRIVFVSAGDGHFDEVPVAILFEDEERVVLAAAANPRLTSGQQIVLRGAFELGLAMHAGDAGAAHDHEH